MARAGLLKKGIRSALIAAFVWSAIPWPPYSHPALAGSRAAGKLILLDFYAAWCTCRELERKDFFLEQVVKAARGFVALKAEMTNTYSPGAQRLAKK